MKGISAAVIGALVVGACVALVGCGQGASGPVDTAATSTVATGERTFTLSELAGFNGKSGNPAYVAVDGVVYDVSASIRWPQGEHTSCNLGAMAGKDLSEEMKQAPANMRALLQNMPVMGKLAP